jgi:hypothetical protein
MISVVHAEPEASAGEDTDFPIPAGGRRMEMDWDCVAAAFQRAVDQLRWYADLEIRPEKQYVMVRIPSDRWQQVTRTTSEFYALVEDAIGTEQFMSIWIDFASRDTCSTQPTS